MKKSTKQTKYSIVQRGQVAARLLVEGIAVDEVATRCKLNPELVLQVLVKRIYDSHVQLAGDLAAIQRLYNVLVEQLRKGVVYPDRHALIDPVLLRRHIIDEPGPKNQLRKVPATTDKESFQP